MNELEERHPGRSFCFTMDNLNVYHNAGVVNLILNAGHCLVFRAPYWAVDGAIEYVFNTIHTGLLMYYNQLRDMDELVNATLIRRFTEELFQKKIYLILLMTQCMVHCVQFLYKIFIFNPFVTQGVEFLLTFAFKGCLVPHCWKGPRTQGPAQQGPSTKGRVQWTL